MREHRTISIADQIFEQLERDILTGKYPKGEVLSELRLSSELGVSRTPVREAVRRLEQENILKETGRGMVVVGISREDMMDMYEVRMQLEGLAARRAAANISDEQLKDMEDCLALQRFYVEKQDGGSPEQIRDMDSRFHQLLYESSGSRAYQEVLKALHKKIVKYRCASISKQTRAVRSLAEHRAIYEALAAHDGDAAEKAALEHVANARDSVTEMEM